MITIFAFLALAVQADAATPLPMDWTITRHTSEHVLTGYVGYLSRDTGKIWIVFQSSGEGDMVATVGAHYCEEQRDLDLNAPAEHGLNSDPRRPVKIQARLSLLLTEIASACQMSRPADRLFFRGFRRAFIAFEHTDK